MNTLDENVNQVLSSAKLTAKLNQAAPLQSTLLVKASEQLERAVAEDLELEDKPLRDILES